MNKFTSAYDRARVLARAALPTNEVVAVVAAHPRPENAMGASRRGWKKGTAFELVKDMGIVTEAAIASWNGYWWPDHEMDDEVEPWVHRVVRVTWDQADILLWNQIAQDIGVFPQAPVMSKFVDAERGVSVSAYDDRGMDITALTKEPIAKLHHEFNAWLLDFDRPRMAEAFEV